MQTQHSNGSSPERAGRYQRVSKFIQKAKGYGAQVQQDDGDAYIARKGYVVVGAWDDTDSGAEWELPGLDAMLDAAKAGAFTVLVVPEPDRFARNVVKQFIIEEELRSYGVRVEYSRFDLDDSPEGRLLKGNLALFAEYEREKIRFRTSRGRYKKAQHGTVVGQGRPPYGYEYTYNEDHKVNGLRVEPAQAAVIRRIVAALPEQSMVSLAAQLTAEGIPAPHAHEAPRRTGARTQRGRPRTRGPLSGRWTEGTLRGFIENPVYTGTAVFGRRDKRGAIRPETEWLRATVEPLATPEEIARAKAGMAARRNAGRRPSVAPGTPDRYELRGRLPCARCGGAMACITRKSRGNRYD